MSPGPRTAPAAGTTALPGTAACPGPAVVAVAAGCGLLLLRPVVVDAWRPDPTAALVVLFLALGVVGLAWPLRPPVGDVPEAGERLSPGTLVGAIALGLGAFAVGRLLGGGRAPVALAVHVVVLNSLAAVAEEAFFRRLTYAVFLPAGAGAAVAGSAVLFAVVHLTVYGAWVLPIDLAAGLVLGWQRWVTGSWTVPAVTHVVANLMIVL